MKSPDKVYDNILSLIKVLLGSFTSSTDNEEIKSAQNEALHILQQLQSEIELEYASLKKNTEWKRFTIAFYGETNAGKSTIIEALRLAMKEKTKQITQQNFLEIQKQNNIREEDFDIVRDRIQNLDDLITEAKKRSADVERELDTVKAARNTIISNLEIKVAEERQNWSIIGRIIHLFIKSTLEKELIKEQKDAKNAIDEIIKNKEVVDKELIKINLQYDDAKAEETRMLEECKKLEPYADGNIIGNGESDYTKTNTTYEFNYNGIEFNLIDVPGIEGNEGIVQESIIKAVQKAHAVFYVTNKPTAPQTGDDKEGTLEKIQKHLGSQTEVWTIFNKRTTSPSQLNDKLVNDEEVDALKKLHNVFVDKLGKDHYRGEIVLRGYPAFLSVAICLVPGSKEKRSQNKFLKKISLEKIMDDSGLKNFINLFPGTIIGEWKHKIIASNYNKAIEALNRMIVEISNLQTKKVVPLEKSMRRIHDDTKLQLENMVDALSSSLKCLKSDLIGEFESSVRSEIYDVISDDVNNDTFEAELKCIMERNQELLLQDFSKSVQECIEETKNDIEEIINTFKNNMDDIIDTYDSLEMSDINLKINIDNGIDVKALIGAAFSAIGIFISSGPVGWVLGTISLIISIGKAIWEHIDHSYRQKQQRKSADENIRKVSQDIEKSLDNYMIEINGNMEKIIPSIARDLEKQMLMVININKSLDNAQHEIVNMINQTRESMNHVH